MRFATPAHDVPAVTPQILVIEGLHPFYDERVRDLLDFKIYLDISDDVKFAWKLQVSRTGRTLVCCVAEPADATAAAARHPAALSTVHISSSVAHVPALRSWLSCCP